MIQFNLLPDVKLEYIKARRAKRMVIVISTLISGAMVAVLILLFTVVKIFQQTHLHGLQHDIDTYSKNLQNTPDLNKILTVQNQLESLPDLLNRKPVASRLFTFIAQTTPSDVTISKYQVDFNQHSFAIEGNSGSLESLNRFVDTLKFTTYGTDKNAPKAFSGVVLTNFSRSTDEGASYHIDLTFDQAIFDSTKDIGKLNVPITTTTRSETEKPVFVTPSNQSR